MKKIYYLFTIICLFMSTHPLTAAKKTHLYVKSPNGIVESFDLSPNRKINELKNEIAHKFHIDQTLNRIILRHNGYTIFSDESDIETYPYIYKEGLDFIVVPITPIIEDDRVIIEEGIRPRREFWRERKREFVERRDFRGNESLEGNDSIKICKIKRLCYFIKSLNFDEYCLESNV